MFIQISSVCVMKLIQNFRSMKDCFVVTLELVNEIINDVIPACQCHYRVSSIHEKS